VSKQVANQFLRTFNLAQMFTTPNVVGKYMPSQDMDRDEFPGCMKPIEFFTNDIHNNLQEWTTFGGNVLLYRTLRYWYEFRVDEQDKGLVYMTRYDNSAWRRWDSWANAHSIEDIGKEWLLQEPQKSKYVKLAEGAE
jgi:hypothetical protein